MQFFHTHVWWMAMVVSAVAAGCVRKTSREFDEPLQVPQVPVASKRPFDTDANSASVMQAVFDSSGIQNDLPETQVMSETIGPGNAPWGPTATYVPVKSPREIPSSQPVTSSSLPAISSPMLQEIRDPSQLPAGTPIVIAPPPVDTSLPSPSP